MNLETLRSQTFLWDAVTAGAILAGFLAAALLVRLIWGRVMHPLVSRFAPDLDETLLTPLRGLAFWGLTLMGVYSAVISLERVETDSHLVALLGTLLSLAWLVLAIWTLLRIFNAVVAWYVARAAQHSAGSLNISGQANLIRKTINLVVLLIGFLYMLRIAGVDISPLLASGAIGGLAIALAMQDTLANVFAGYWLAIDRPVRVGDYVKLESGEEGFIDEIGWRNTKVRMWANNVVVVPNSKLSQSILTNYYLPQPKTSVYIPCGVSYDCDLDHVEQITVEVAREVQQAIEGADTEWEPVVRWKTFGDSSIDFVAVLRVRDFGQQYLLQSEFIKALHRRFCQEKVEIPYPIRTLRFDPGALSYRENGTGNAEAALPQNRAAKREREAVA